MHQRIRNITVGIAAVQEEDPLLAPSIELAEALGADLHVVHAFSPPDPILASLDPVADSDPDGLQALRDEVQSLLEARIGDCPGKGVIVCHAVPGSPADVVFAVSEREGSDLIIVGASRRGPIASAVLGTTAQRVLRASTAPVLVNRRLSAVPPRRILFTTDLSEISARVHERGTELVAGLWSSPDVEMRLLLVAGDDLLLPPPGYHLMAMRERAQAQLAAFLERTPSGADGVEGRVRLGLSTQEILAEAEEWGADLLVLGTHSRRGISRFLIGSVAETVSRRAPCDVLILPLAAVGPVDGVHQRVG